MDITLRQLSVFVAIARGGNLAEASARCGITRAAVSMALSSLERMAGGPLFVRAGHGLRLNDRGRMLLPGAEGLVSGAHEWLASARGQGGELAGELRLGCSLTIGNYCLPAVLQGFRKAHPKASVSVRIGNSSDTAAGLRDGAFDLALVESDAVLHGFDAEVWAKDELLVVAAPLDPLSRRAGELALRDLAGREWVLREPGSGTREIAESFLRRVPGVRARIEMGGAEAIKRAVASGMGLALLSRHAVSDELASGRLCALRISRNPLRRFHLLQVPGQHMSSLCRSFRDWLRDNRPA